MESNLKSTKTTTKNIIQETLGIGTGDTPRTRGRDNLEWGTQEDV